MSEIDFIHRYLPGSGENQRVFLLLHGTGGDESDLLPLGRELDPGAALLSPRGKVSENGRPRFFRRFAEGVFDEADVVKRANELADFVAAAGERYKFETRQVIAVGYSNGANIAAAVLLLRPGTIKSAVLLRAMVPITPSPLPKLPGTRALICSGTRDPIIPMENAERLTAMLRNAGATVTLRIEEAGHQLVFDEIAAAKNWLYESSRE
jgi:phospholipase/carboxylesterase